VVIGAAWQLTADPTAAAGKAVWNPNANKAKVSSPLVAPASYVEQTFDALAGTAYHVWVRLKAENDSKSNDSFYLQFSDSVTSSGAATQRIGTSSAAEFILEDGPSGGAESGWGWADNGWGPPGALIYFAASGTHTLRMQQREDGPFVDQIVLSPDTYITNAPGPRFADSTILPEGASSATCTDPNATNYGGPAPCQYPPPPPPLDSATIVVYPATGTMTGNWQLKADTTAADGEALWNPNGNQAKVSPALASPPNYVDVAFDAKAGTAYHVWVRMRAENDSFANDSIHLQFDDSVTSTGAATQRIGTSSSAEFVLQNGPTGPAAHAWGWTDNGWGAPGAPIYFATTGPHTLRIQQREDGAMVDQIVLSPTTYLTSSPGTRSNDTTILPETTSTPPSCSVTLSPTNNQFPATGATGSFAVTTSDQSCTWSATSTAAWLTVNSGSGSGTGNGTVTFTVGTNDGAARSGAINVAGQAFGATQDAAQQGTGSVCSTVTLDSTAKTVGGTEANWIITVTAPSSTCTWTASADATWLVVKSTTPTAAPVAGSGTVKVRAVANTTGAARTGHFTINGVVYTVKQLAG